MNKLDYDPRWGDLTPPDIEHLSEDEKIEYWGKATMCERLRELQRLRRLDYGPAADGPMDKTKFEVIDLSKYHSD